MNRYFNKFFNNSKTMTGIYGIVNFFNGSDNGRNWFLIKFRLTNSQTLFF